jgi:excisionase family DNA binding protein
MSSISAPPFGSSGGSLLTAQDVATILGVPAPWVYAKSRAGAIPTVKLGRYYRYRADAIHEWVKTHEVAA